MECIKKRLEEWITPRTLSWFFFIVYLVSLIPMFVIGLYNYPSADDYSIGSNARQTWMASHSMIQTVWQAVLRAAEDWMIWMGYFTSNFLMAIPPCVFGEKWYALTTVIMVGSVSLSTGYLLYQLFVKVLKADKYISNSVIFIMLFFTMQCMVGRVEAFYWYCGAANYMLTHSMAMCFYGMLVSLAVSIHRKAFVIVAAGLGFLVGGANQMTALNVAIVLFVGVIFISYTRKWKEKMSLLIPTLTFYIGFILNIAAPGNWVRSEISHGMGPIKAVMISLLYGLEYCLGEWTDWSVLIMIIALIPLLWKLTARTDFRFPYPVVVIIFGFGLVAAMMTPPLFAVGNIGAARLQAVTFTVYMLVLILCELYAVGWFQKKYFMVKVDGNKLSADIIIFLMSCVLFFGTGAGLKIIANPHYYTSSSAMTDLLNGSAKAYGEALRERAELYNSGEKDIIVDALETEPELLYFSDITEDPEDWQNRGLCRYYGLDSIRKIKK